MNKTKRMVASDVAVWLTTFMSAIIIGFIVGYIAGFIGLSIVRIMLEH